MMKKVVSQLFTTSWLGLGFAATLITADKRLRYASPKLPSATSFYLQYVIRNRLWDARNKKIQEKVKNDDTAVWMLYISSRWFSSPTAFGTYNIP